MAGKLQELIGAKIAKITKEEKKKPKGKRRDRKAIIGKALGILRHEGYKIPKK